MVYQELHLPLWGGSHPSHQLCGDTKTKNSGMMIIRETSSCGCNDWTKTLDVFHNVWKGLKAAWKRSTSTDSSSINTEQGNKDESAPNDERQNDFPSCHENHCNNAMKDRLKHHTEPDAPNSIVSRTPPWAPSLDSTCNAIGFKAWPNVESFRSLSFWPMRFQAVPGRPPNLSRS